MCNIYVVNFEIEVDVTGIGFEGVDWTQLSQDRENQSFFLLTC